MSKKSSKPIVRIGLDYPEDEFLKIKQVAEMERRQPGNMIKFIVDQYVNKKLLA